MDNEIISFSLVKIERGREKLCKCDPPHYEVDTVNRIVSCQDCGATIDAFDALVTLAKRYEQLEDAQRKMISKDKLYGAMADAEFKRMRRNNERLIDYCRQQDRPISWVIRQALDNYLPV